MRNYLIYRALLIVPTLFIISLVAFWLSRNVPQDPVISVLNMRGVTENDLAMSQRAYEKVYRELGYDKPAFYFSIIPAHYPDNIHTIADPQRKAWVKEKLQQGYDYALLAVHLEKNADWYPGAGLLEFDADQKHHVIWPSFRWHGTDNQYHQWIGSLFEGTFGISIADGLPALQKSLKALSWTLAITLTDLVLSLVLGIWLGIWLARSPDGKWQNRVSKILYGLYAMPLFWLATLAIIFLTTNTYGSWLNIFPSAGIDVYPGKSNFDRIVLNFDKLLLPILVLTVHSLAYISRFVRRSILNEMEKPYILMAYSKGLTRNQAINRHALRNALVPVITILGAVIPGAFTGSLVLEVLFNIPGFGRLLYTSISLADWNVVFCILLLVAFVTVLSYLLTDILYALFNPKIRYTR